MDLQKLKIDRPEASPSVARSTGSKRGRKRGFPLGWLLFFAALAAVAFVFRAPLEAWVDRLRLPEVEVYEVAAPSRIAASAISGTSANGYIVARNRAALSADTPGRVVEMNVEEGSVVQEGDVVARLFADEFAAALKRTEGELEVARRLAETRRAQVRASQSDLEVSRASVREAEARLRDAKARLELAVLQKDRAERLLADGVLTQEAVDQALAEDQRARATASASEAALESARLAALQGERGLEVAQASVEEAMAGIRVQEAAVEQARATLDKTAVRAPFDGVVILKDAEIGEVVSPNAQGSTSRGSVVTMVDFGSLEVQVEVPETNLAAVTIGEEASVYLDAYPRDLYRGSVQRIWPTANRQKATVEVRVVFLEPDDRLRPEMGVRVVFAAPGSSSASGDEGSSGDGDPPLVIPKRGTLRVDGVDGVFVVERDTVRWRPVELGARRTDKIAILGGLEEGERVVLDPVASLQDGDRVRVR